MQLKTIKIEKPEDTNFIIGQTHFIKSVEDRLLLRLDAFGTDRIGGCDAAGVAGVRYIKGLFPTARPLHSAWQTVVVGGLAATAASVIAKAIG